MKERSSGGEQMKGTADEGAYWARLSQRETALRHQPLELVQEGSTLHLNVNCKGDKTYIIPLVLQSAVTSLTAMSP